MNNLVVARKLKYHRFKSCFKR